MGRRTTKNAERHSEIRSSSEIVCVGDPNFAPPNQEMPAASRLRRWKPGPNHSDGAFSDLKNLD